MIVNPVAQGRGVGRALMLALFGCAQAAGRHTMIAAISGENDAARTFHAGLGFVAVGLLPGVGTKFGRRLDLHLMQKTF